MKSRVGIDFHVVDGKYQGSRTHVLELFSSLIRKCPDIDFYCFLDDLDNLKSISDIFLLPNVKLIRMETKNPFYRLFVQLPKLVKQYKLDILHVQYISPIFLPKTCKKVVTIHDVLFESHPQFFTKFFTFRSKLLMRLSALISDCIFTVSEFSKSEIIKFYKMPEGKISVIYNAADFIRFHPVFPGEKFCYAGLKSKAYFLSVGRLEPRKNHISLVRAYAACLKENMPPLIIVGQPDFNYHEVLNFIQEHNLESRIKVFSDVSDIDLPILYRNALAFFYPAFAEGFGMPPLEAMSSGTLVVSSDTTSMSEVIGSSGILIDPLDVNQLSETMSKIINDPKSYDKMANDGLLRSKLFSWDNSAEIVKLKYNELLDEKK